MTDLDRGWNYLRNRLIDELAAHPPKTTLDIRLTALRMAETLANEFGDPSLKDLIWDVYKDVIGKAVQERRANNRFIRPQERRF